MSAQTPPAPDAGLLALAADPQFVDGLGDGIGQTVLAALLERLPALLCHGGECGILLNQQSTAAKIDIRKRNRFLEREAEIKHANKRLGHVHDDALTTGRSEREHRLSFAVEHNGWRHG